MRNAVSLAVRMARTPPAAEDERALMARFGMEPT